MKKWTSTAVILFFAAIIFNQAVEMEVTALMQEKLDKKVEEYRLQRRSECVKQAIQKAIIHVDSIIHLSFSYPVEDSLKKFVRPTKPTDTLHFEIDTQPIKPIWEDGPARVN